MNWIILIVAGLFEVAFASSLEKAKLSSGNAVYWWYTAFFVSLTISMLLLMKAVQTLPIGNSLCRMDRDRSSRNGFGRDLYLQRPGELLENVFHGHVDRFHYRVESGFALSCVSSRVIKTYSPDDEYGKSQLPFGDEFVSLTGNKFKRNTTFSKLKPNNLWHHQIKKLPRHCIFCKLFKR